MTKFLTYVCLLGLIVASVVVYFQLSAMQSSMQESVSRMQEIQQWTAANYVHQRKMRLWLCERFRHEQEQRDSELSAVRTEISDIARLLEPKVLDSLKNTPKEELQRQQQEALDQLDERLKAAQEQAKQLSEETRQAVDKVKDALNPGRLQQLATEGNADGIRKAIADATKELEQRKRTLEQQIKKKEQQLRELDDREREILADGKVTPEEKKQLDQIEKKRRRIEEERAKLEIELKIVLDLQCAIKYAALGGAVALACAGQFELAAGLLLVGLKTPCGGGPGGGGGGGGRGEGEGTGDYPPSPPAPPGTGKPGDTSSQSEPAREPTPAQPSTPEKPQETTQGGKPRQLSSEQQPKQRPKQDKQAEKKEQEEYVLPGKTPDGIGFYLPSSNENKLRWRKNGKEGEYMSLHNEARVWLVRHLQAVVSCVDPGKANFENRNIVVLSDDRKQYRIWHNKPPILLERRERVELGSLLPAEGGTIPVRLDAEGDSIEAYMGKQWQKIVELNEEAKELLKKKGILVIEVTPPQQSGKSGVVVLRVEEEGHRVEYSVTNAGVQKGQVLKERE